MAAKREKLVFAVDFTEVEEADDGDTTRYGGVYRLDGETFNAVGDDRSDNHRTEVIGKIYQACAEKWPRSKRWFEIGSSFFDSMEEAVTDGANEHADRFEIVVTKTANKLTAKARPMSAASEKKNLEKLPPKVRAAKELGDLLGDLLANHVDEYEDELASGLAESVAGGDLEDAGLKPTDDVLNLALNEAMGYMREAMRPILRKALTDRAQTPR